MQLTRAELWRSLLTGSLPLLLASGACTRPPGSLPAHDVQAQSSAAPAAAAGTSPVSVANGEALGFDRNDYPGDDAMAALHRTFAWTGYWLTNPPGENANTWEGKRSLLRVQGWGFLVLANGRLDAEILKAAKRGTKPGDLGRSDATAALAAARREGFPARTLLFLDQEEGGRLLDEQAGYLLAWTEAVASSGFRPGVYASGQPVADDPGTTIDTVRDIRERVRKSKLHAIAIFDAQDACPPAPGCTVQPHPLAAAGEPDLAAWQYAQSPRRPEITRSCAQTYAADGNCYAPASPKLFLDMDVARSADPSAGR